VAADRAVAASIVPGAITRQAITFASAITQGDTCSFTGRLIGGRLLERFSYEYESEQRRPEPDWADYSRSAPREEASGHGRRHPINATPEGR
jgi:hypothetical protein